MAEHKLTIDERLERLTERHEALSQSLELFIHEGRESQNKNEKLVAAMVEGINSLARIAHAHENRITNLEDRS